MNIKMKANRSNPAARSVVNPSTYSTNVIFPSAKMGCAMGLESILSANAATLLEASSNVAEYYAEPKTMVIPCEGGKPFRYTPDFEVVWSNGEVDYVEVKPLKRAIKPKIAERLSIVGDHLNSQGYGFHIWTEEEIRFSDTLLNNLEWMKWVNLELTYPFSDLEQWVPKSPTTIKELARKSGGLRAVYEMIARQMVYCDLSQDLDQSNAVRSIQGGDYEYLG